MKNIIVARHTDYKVDGRMDPLTPLGREQAEKLARKLQERLTGTFYFAASMQFRSAHVARIVSDIICPENLDRIPELYTGEGQEDFFKIDTKLKTQTADNAVLIGHHPTVSLYSRYLAQTRFAQELDIPEIHEGQAVHFNLEAKTFELLSI